MNKINTIKEIQIIPSILINSVNLVNPVQKKLKGTTKKMTRIVRQHEQD